jgi:hypothetical protein
MPTEYAAMQRPVFDPHRYAVRRLKNAGGAFLDLR